MPRLDLLLLPLLAGYIFLVNFNVTKYYHQRIEKQLLLYNALILAFLFAVIAYLFDYVILKSDRYIGIGNIKSDKIYVYRKNISDLFDAVFAHQSVPGLKHSILIFLMAYPMAKFLNIFFGREFSYDYTIRKWGSQLDRLFWLSLTEKKDEDKLLMLTTKSNKVYIGYVSKLSEPIGETFITILPNYSGYRNKDNLKIEITTRYTDVIKKYIQENRIAEIDDKLGIVLPVSEILIISRFDNEIFGRFNENVVIEAIETDSNEPSTS